MSSGWLRSRAGEFELEVQWEVEPGEVLVLFGRSGSGKTMTLRSITGMMTPLQGSIEVGGNIVFDNERRVDVPPHRRNIGYVPQDWLVFPHLSVSGNIGYGLRQWEPAARRAQISSLIERLGLDGLEARHVGALSGGQHQRVALARALAPGPALLLLDEPFSALDLETRRQVREEVRKVLRDAGIPVILVTHDREEAISLGDRVTVLDNGRVMGHGEPVSLLGHPPRERVASLMGVENLLCLVVKDTQAYNGVMHCGRDAFSLEAPFSDVQIGQEVTLGIRADDILLASARPVGLSARNVLQGRVVSVTPEGPLYAVGVDCGVVLTSHVTRNSVQELGLHPGNSVWLIVKTASCFLLRDDG